jgi:hypothetical protein
MCLLVVRLPSVRRKRLRFADEAFRTAKGKELLAVRANQSFATAMEAAVDKKARKAIRDTACFGCVRTLTCAGYALHHD